MSSTIAMDRECDIRTLTTAGGVARRSCSVLVPSPSQDALLLYGGVGANTYYNDVHTFSIEARRWTEVYPIGSRPSPRGGCASSVLHQRTLYIFGGRGEEGFLSDVFTLDLVHLGWSPVIAAGQRPSAREDSVMAASSSGHLYLLGGCSAAGAESDLWRFDPTQSHWDLIQSTAAPFPDGIAAPCMAHSDHHMYVFGGYDKFGTFTNLLWKFSVKDHVWNQIEIRGGVPRPRTHGQLALCDGNLLLYGGYSTAEALSDVWQLISVSAEINSDDCFVILGEEVRANCGVDTILGRGAASSTVAQRSLFVFGGCDGATFLQDLLTVSLASVERSPARRQVAGHSRTWLPQAASVSASGAVEHPYNVASPYANTTSIVVASPAAADVRSDFTTRGPSAAPTQLAYHEGGMRAGGTKYINGAAVGGSLMHAITDLKAELFGPRVAHVDTIMEENRKLREENAKLQQTVLDLMRRLSYAGASLPTHDTPASGSVLFPTHVYQQSPSALPTAAFAL
jgi:hypothetical protein